MPAMANASRMQSDPGRRGWGERAAISWQLSPDASRVTAHIADRGAAMAVFSRHGEKLQPLPDSGHTAVLEHDVCLLFGSSLSGEVATRNHSQGRDQR